jgi:hypothetical protein
MKKRKMLLRLAARVKGWQETMNSVKMTKFVDGFHRPGSQNRKK